MLLCILTCILRRAIDRSEVRHLLRGATCVLDRGFGCSNASNSNATTQYILRYGQDIGWDSPMLRSNRVSSALVGAESPQQLLNTKPA